MANPKVFLFLFLFTISEVFWLTSKKGSRFWALGSRTRVKWHWTSTYSSENRPVSREWNSVAVFFERWRKKPAKLSRALCCRTIVIGKTPEAEQQKYYNIPIKLQWPRIEKTMLVDDNIFFEKDAFESSNEIENLILANKNEGGIILKFRAGKVQDTCIVLYVLYVLSCVGVMSCVLSCMYCRAC